MGIGGLAVVIIKLKANLSSTGTGLPIRTELGKNEALIRMPRSLPHYDYNKYIEIANKAYSQNALNRKHKTPKTVTILCFYSTILCLSINNFSIYKVSWVI